MSEQPECEKCANCAERAETVLAMAEQLKLVDDNDRCTQILDLIIHLHHRYDQLPADERDYATWDDLIASVDIHYNAEVEGEDCIDCPRHPPEPDEDDDETKEQS